MRQCVCFKVQLELKVLKKVETRKLDVWVQDLIIPVYNTRLNTFNPVIISTPFHQIVTVSSLCSRSSTSLFLDLFSTSSTQTLSLTLSSWVIHSHLYFTLFLTKQKTHVWDRECYWSAQSHKTYRPSYLTAASWEAILFLPTGVRS